jgi:hypothetical protein
MKKTQKQKINKSIKKMFFICINIVILSILVFSPILYFSNLEILRNLFFVLFFWWPFILLHSFFRPKIYFTILIILLFLSLIVWYKIL